MDIKKTGQQVKGYAKIVETVEATLMIHWSEFVSSQYHKNCQF